MQAQNGQPTRRRNPIPRGISADITLDNCHALQFDLANDRTMMAWRDLPKIIKPTGRDKRLRTCGQATE